MNCDDSGDAVAATTRCDGYEALYLDTLTKVRLQVNESSNLREHCASMPLLWTINRPEQSKRNVKNGLSGKKKALEQHSRSQTIYRRDRGVRREQLKRLTTDFTDFRTDSHRFLGRGKGKNQKYD